MNKNSIKKKYMVANREMKLTTSEKIEILSQFPLFSEANEYQLRAFAEKMYPRRIHNMEVFVEEDLDEKEAFFVFKGAVSIFRTSQEGEIINLELLGAPEVVGETGLIDSKPSPASAIAIEETQALVLHQDNFQMLLAEHSVLAMSFLKVFSDKVRSFNVFIEQLLSNNLYQRTWFTLQFLANYFPNREITLSQEELADLIWGTRSRVTEALNQLEEEGKITISRRKIKLLGW